MSERFYSAEPIKDGCLELAGDEAHHLLRVMRRQIGDDVLVFDGSGDEFTARIRAATRHTASLEVLQRTQPNRELPGSLTIATALPKGDRQRYLVEKCVEIGVHRLVPLRTARGVAESTSAAIARLQRYVVEATKQSGRTRLMVIAEPQAATELFALPIAADAQRWLADPSGVHCAGGMQGTEQWIAIGPEGGWTADELSAARDHRWQVISLGPRILRMETAAVVTAALAAQWLQQGSLAD